VRRIPDSERTNEDIRLPPIEYNQFVSRSRTTSPEEHGRLSASNEDKDEEKTTEAVQRNRTTHDHKISRNSQYQNLVSSEMLNEEYYQNSITTEYGFQQTRKSIRERSTEIEYNHYTTNLQEHNQATVTSEVNDVYETMSVKNSKQADFSTAQNISEEDAEDCNIVNEGSRDSSAIHQASLHKGEINEEIVREEHASLSVKESTIKKDIDVVASLKNEQNASRAEDNERVETKDLANESMAATDSRSEQLGLVTEADTEVKNAHEDLSITELNEENHQDLFEQHGHDNTTVKQNKKVSRKQLSQKRAKMMEEDNPIISRLDKMVDKDLRSFQSLDSDQSEGEDDVDEQTITELLYGKYAKELNDFLSS